MLHSFVTFKLKTQMSPAQVDGGQLARPPSQFELVEARLRSEGNWNEQEQLQVPRRN